MLCKAKITACLIDSKYYFPKPETLNLNPVNLTFPRLRKIERFAATCWSRQGPLLFEPEEAGTV